MIKTFGISLGLLDAPSTDVELQEEGGTLRLNQFRPADLEGELPAITSYGTYLYRKFERFAEIQRKDYDLHVGVDVTGVGPLFLEPFQDELGEVVQIRGYVIDPEFKRPRRDSDWPLTYISPRDLAARLQLGLETEEIRFREISPAQKTLKEHAASVLSHGNPFHQQYRGGPQGELLTALGVAYWHHFEYAQ